MITSLDGPIAHDEYRAAAQLRAGLRGFLHASERVLRTHGLTPERYELLLAIRVGDQASVGELAAVLNLALSSTTQLVRRAEDAGLVRREVSPRDARVRHLRLTEQGERRLAAAVAALRPERERLAAVIARLDSSGQ